MEAQYLETLNPIYRNTMWIDFILVFGSMALITWPPYARLVRAQVLSIRSRPYVTAAQAHRPANRHHHVAPLSLPNAMGPLIVAVSAGLGTAMVLESAFSFLGVGVNAADSKLGQHDFRRPARLAALPASAGGTCGRSGLGHRGLQLPRRWTE